MRIPVIYSHNDFIVDINMISNLLDLESEVGTVVFAQDNVRCSVSWSSEYFT